jgi:hypothetical protein
MSADGMGGPAPAEVVALSNSTDTLLDALSGLDAERLNRRPAPGEWSVWDIAYHVAQIEVWYVAKLCEAASADAPAAVARFLEAWQRLRDHALALARSIPAERLDTPGLLSGVPDWTPRRLLEAIAVHDHEHAEQARAASRDEPAS